MPSSQNANSLVVRDAVASVDAAACASIYAPYVTDTTITFEETPADAKDFERRIAQAQTRHAWLVGEVGGTVVGYAYAGTYRPRAAYRWSCETSIYLDRERRGTGLGRVLYAQLLDRLTELGYRTAVAGTTLPNPASHRLHAALGFQEIGVFRCVGYKFGRWCDVAWAQRALE